MPPRKRIGYKIQDAVHTSFHPERDSGHSVDHSSQRPRRRRASSRPEAHDESDDSGSHEAHDEYQEDGEDLDNDEHDYCGPSTEPRPQRYGSRARRPLKVMMPFLKSLRELNPLWKKHNAKKITISNQEELTPRYQVIYRVNCHDSGSRNETLLYLEVPWISRSGPHQSHLRAGNAIRNWELFLERGKEISFVVYKNFECCRKAGPSHLKECYDDPAAEISDHFVGETISIISDDLRCALQQLSLEALDGIPHPSFEARHKSSLSYPYLWWYHRRDRISQAQSWLDILSQQHVGVFHRYLQLRLGDEWEAVDSMISKGRITLQYIEYIFIPNTILVSTLNGKGPATTEGLLADGWLKTYVNNATSSNPANPLPSICTINCICWIFDGNFQRTKLAARIEVMPTKEDFTITDLAVYPAKFADEELRKSLRDRGEMYWKCRKQRYVYYENNTSENFENTADQRFMVDMAIYKQLHPPDPSVVPHRDDIGLKRMSEDRASPLGDEFLMCLPTTIPGFNMQKKEWVNLEVSNIKDVEWNREAFDLLVADKGTKELVRALVENHCNAEKNTDLISGKGNGLFILLHGAPGTGKTLTAETVAEIAEKPLYRVTCGDIGTKAEDVEKYLETVLLLGKTWSCVVLLDEADVFLEERTLFDLQRNALVSVFLRVLEYYDGILILTSNRVGIFDEAFKSRTQLTLRYKNLEEPQRKTIWGNLISRLEKHQQTRPLSTKAKSSLHTKEHNVDVEEIRANINTLAKAELNGRQIRNAVATARQLAMFRDEPMRYEHLRVVIDEIEKFDSYLREVTGCNADLIQRDKGIR